MSLMKEALKKLLEKSSSKDSDVKKKSGDILNEEGEKVGEFEAVKKEIEIPLEIDDEEADDTKEMIIEDEIDYDDEEESSSEISPEYAVKMIEKLKELKPKAYEQLKKLCEEK